MNAASFMVCIVWKKKSLGESRVRKFFSEIFALLLVFAAAVLLLEFHHKISILVEMNLEVLLGHAGRCKFKFVFIVCFDDIDGRNISAYFLERSCLEEVVEEIIEAELAVSSICW